MTTSVPFNDLGRRSAAGLRVLTDAVERVISSGWYLLGPETEAFEREFATSCGTVGCVAVANGTDALEIALRSVGCEAGDEVVTTANAGMYSTIACLAIGATPVFADIEPGSLLMSLDSARSLVTDHTRAVVATHLYGNVVDVESLRSHLPPGVAVVEDCAQAHGASLRGKSVGSLGTVAAFSFYPTKNLGALGDAGAVVSGDAEVLARAQALRQYGWEDRYLATIAGGRNSRMDEIQAAVLRTELSRLHDRNRRRQWIRAHYRDALSDVLTFVEGGGAGDATVAHLCVARSPRRDELIDLMRGQGVACAIHYPFADHMQPALEGRTFRHGGLTETERACAEVISLPCFPELRDDEVALVIDAVRRCT